jgi:tetratricopeptide (TPR) repeat protein
VLTDQKVIDYFSNDMVLAKLNAEQDTLAAKEYHVMAFPMLVMINPDGTEVDRIVGYLPPDEFLETLENYQQGIGTLADLLQKAEGSEDRGMFFEIADKYKYSGRSDQAVDWYEKVIDMGDPTDSLAGESRMAMADMLRRAKDYSGAINSFDQIMKDFQGTVFAQDAEIWKAIVYKQKGDTAAAILGFQEYVDQYPESEDAEYAKGQIEKLQGKTDEKTD